MQGDAFALELWLDRREARLVPELAAHDRAVLARARDDRDPPPPPPALLDPVWLELPARAQATGDGRLAQRAATLARWSLAARVAMDPAVRAARAATRELDGLDARYAALAEAARRLGFAEVGALVRALYGAAPAAGPTGAVDDGDDDGADDVALAADLADPARRSAIARGRLPAGDELLAALARVQRIDPSPITLEAAPRSLTIAIPGDRIHCLVARGADPLADVVLAAHEVGHGLRAAAVHHLPPTLAAPLDRAVDEAAAARAVRALESMIDDPPIRATLVRRRRRRERLTRALAAFEAACLGGVAPAVAWERVAQVDRRAPAAFPALFDEPGVMAAYAAADVRAGQGP